MVEAAELFFPKMLFFASALFRTSLACSARSRVNDTYDTLSTPRKRSGSTTKSGPSPLEKWAMLAEIRVMPNPKYANSFTLYGIPGSSSARIPSVFATESSIRK